MQTHKVIDLKVHGAKRRSNASAPGVSAEIILFPGIRYEYHERAASVAPTNTAPSRQQAGE